MDLEDKILGRIEQEHIRRRSRWLFRAADVSRVIAALALLSVSGILCGIAIVLAVHMASEISWTNFPYSLVVLSGISLFLAYESLVRSFFLYRIRTSFLVTLLALAAFSSGYFVYAHGQAEMIERKLQKMPAYHQIVPRAAWERESHEDRE